MKNSIIFFLIILGCSTVGYSTTHTIGNSGNTFTPATLSISLGDTVKFVVASSHEPREVSQATWNANGTTSNGGFDLPPGGGTVVLTTTGTHYYVCVPHASSGMKGTITVNSVTDVESISQTIPESFILMQSYPNPFNPSTIIRYAIPSDSKIKIVIYDLLGQQITELLNAAQSAGYHEVRLNAGNMPSGVYLYRITAESTDGKKEFVDTKKMLLLK